MQNHSLIKHSLRVLIALSALLTMTVFNLSYSQTAAQGTPAPTEKKKSGWVEALDALLTPKPAPAAEKANVASQIEAANNPVAAGAEEQSGTLVVRAESALGSRFRNTGAKPFMMEIYANGRWTVNGKDYCGPAGYPNVPSVSAEYRLPGQALGALIVRRGSGKYELISGNRTLRLLPKETVYFCINDSDGGHGDNSGTVKIEWTGDYEAE